MNAQLVTREETASLPAPQVSTTPNQLLALAVQQGADLDRLERLMALQERWEANEARKAFVSAMAAFKAEPMTITKDKHVSFATSKGTTEYDHATLGNVVRTVVAGLARHGMSHSWQTERMDGGRVQVTCRITHCQGHSESIALDAGLDDSGGKNNIQALGSAITYLQRYTLLSITGLATEDQDDDGKRSGGKPDAATITEEQAAKLQDAIEATGRNLAKFKEWCQVEKLTDLRADAFDLAFREASKPKGAK